MYETNWLPKRDAARSGGPLTPQALAFEPEATVATIASRLRDRVALLHRRGVVLGLSGGVDSSVCAALAVKALGPDRVFGLLLPERDSSPASADAAGQVARGLGIETRTEDITAALTAVGCYAWRDEAIRKVFPEYGEGWRNKIAIAGSSGMKYFKLVVQAPDGAVQEKRLPHREYLQIVAATNYKQRVRKTIEYFHADRLHFAVIGTPNRLEYDQGFFVKNGDGSADVKPIAHLYKTQVYALARYLGLPEVVCAGSPTTDTYSLSQGQDEFYFSLRYEQMDLALWAHNHGVPAGELASALSLSEAEAAAVYRDIEAKRQTTAYQHAAPLLIETIHELPHLGD
jgi:NAD+ synthase